MPRHVCVTSLARLGLASFVVVSAACGAAASPRNGASSEASPQAPADAMDNVPGAPANPGDAPSTPSAPGGSTSDGPLPSDPRVFGDKVIAMYIFREPYVRTAGNPPVITAVVNAKQPGTHDLVFADARQRPRYVADCGRSASGGAYGCGRFDGTDDFGVADGFALATGERPSMLLVMKMNNVSNVTAIPFQLTNAEGGLFMNLPEVRTEYGENTWRYNGTFTATPHNIDFGRPDTALHLHEQHLASPATLAVFDGVTQAETGGDSAVTGPLTRVSIGRRAPYEYAAADIFEAIVVDRPTQAEAAQYRTLRVRAEYPTIALP